MIFAAVFFFFLLGKDLEKRGTGFVLLDLIPLESCVDKASIDGSLMLR